MKIGPIFSVILFVLNGSLAGAQTLEAEADYVMQVVESACVPTRRGYDAGLEQPFLISASDAAKCFYRISVIGGKGDDGTKTGGLGGVFVFDFYPTEAGTLTSLVGANGINGTPMPGGGASAIMFNSTLLAVSGGGGGGSYGYRSSGSPVTYAGSNGGPRSAANLCSTGGCPTASGAVTNAFFGITAGGTGQSASGGTGGCIIAQGIGGNGGAGYPGGNGGSVVMSPTICSTRQVTAYGGLGGKGYIAPLATMSNFKFTSTVIDGLTAVGDFGIVLIERMAKP